jgi:hypothetical protein
LKDEGKCEKWNGIGDACGRSMEGFKACEWVRGRNERSVGRRTAVIRCGRWNGGEYGKGGWQDLDRVCPLGTTAASGPAAACDSRGWCVDRALFLLMDG